MLKHILNHSVGQKTSYILNYDVDTGCTSHDENQRYNFDFDVDFEKSLEERQGAPKSCNVTGISELNCWYNTNSMRAKW